jgi:endonuclease/exonuclease/phosphatase family metal-dependent hydrolase
MPRRSGADSITCATYNILRGRYAELIVRNIGLLMESGADIICLQEAEGEFGERLDLYLAEEGLRHWAVEYAHAGHGGDIAILWNTKRLSLTKARAIFLPSLGKPSRLQKLHGHREVYQRLALVAEFLCGDVAVTVLNTHLAWEGGVAHRFRQVRALRPALPQSGPTIVCGDFNTIGPRVVNALQGARARQLLGPGFSNAHPRLRWSFDINWTDPAGWRGTPYLRRMGVRLRSRLDYIFARGVRPVAADMYDLPGSDHRPLIATFELARHSVPTALSE